ncbi:hypothetical protein PILCRDRAFT_829297 [Piloderma croceum F 1598]|uniref:Uncharacterized protein n=1 Tax=Piloderma croceum (strain F 1598) TaxID=765440 RepID=A0A0C3EZZ6_PILCF|nr:hypothetical protein PILCRDRAFT_829297 [Piloderma croceum F 1598]
MAYTIDGLHNDRLHLEVKLNCIEDRNPKIHLLIQPLHMCNVNIPSLRNSYGWSWPSQRDIRSITLSTR